MYVYAVKWFDESHSLHVMLQPVDIIVPNEFVCENRNLQINCTIISYIRFFICCLAIKTLAILDRLTTFDYFCPQSVSCLSNKCIVWAAYICKILPKLFALYINCYLFHLLIMLLTIYPQYNNWKCATIPRKRNAEHIVFQFSSFAAIPNIIFSSSVFSTLNSRNSNAHQTAR